MTGAQKKILKIVFIDRIIFRVLILACALFSALSGLLLPYLQKKFAENLDDVFLIYGVGLTLLYFGLNQLTLFLGQYESVIAQKKIAIKTAHYSKPDRWRNRFTLFYGRTKYKHLARAKLALCFYHYISTAFNTHFFTYCL